MAFILGGMPILMIALMIERRTHRSFAECFPVSVLGVIFFLYCFGLLGLLPVGVYGVYLAGLVSAVFGLLRLKKQKADTGKYLVSLSPGFVLALLALPTIYVLTRGRMLLNWDEFSHWGTVVKNMYLLDALGSSPASTAIYKSYPPSIALIQYYFMRLCPQFTESILYAAKDLLAFSLLSPFFKNIRWRDWKRLILTLILVMALPLVEYYYFYRSIHVDGIMGLLFAYCLISYYGAARRDSFSWISVSLGVFALCQIKSSGFGICLLLLLLILMDALFCRKENLPLSGKPIKAYPFATWLLPVLVLAFAKISWELNLHFSGATDYWNMSSALSPGNMLSSLREMKPYQQETIERFFSALFALRDDTYAVRLSPLSWIALPLVPACIAFLLTGDKAKKRRISRMAALLMIGYGLWLVVLLVSFLFIFTEFEALNLDGFERYSSTFQLGAIVFMVWLMIETWEGETRQKLTTNLVLLMLAAMMLFNGSDLAKATIAAPQYNRYTRTQRESYPVPPDFSRLDEKNDKVLFIGQQSGATGLDFYYLRFCETPVYVGMIGSWSIGEPYDKDDDWTREYTLASWTKDVYDSDYTHLYLYRIDDRFIDNFGGAFSSDSTPEDDALYEIIRAAGTVHFIRVL